MTVLAQFSEAAIARAEQRLAGLEATAARNQLALFHWSEAAQLFEIEVCGLIVATAKDYRGARDFCDMHHAGFAGSRE